MINNDIDSMTDSDAKEYFESIEADYWIDAEKENII